MLWFFLLFKVGRQLGAAVECGPGEAEDHNRRAQGEDKLSARESQQAEQRRAQEGGRQRHMPSEYFSDGLPDIQYFFPL